MSQVHIPPVFEGSGALVEATVDIRLITADGKPCICFNATELATEYQAVTMPMGEGSDGLIVALAPQILLARPDGSATWYQISVRTRHRTEIYRVQVPDVPGVLDLRDLVGASAITADDVLSGRLLPYPGDVADGWSLTVADGLPVWTDTDAPLTGGPFGRFEGAWVEAVGPAGPAGAAGPTAVSSDAGNLAVLGTDNLLLVDSTHVTPAAIGAATVQDLTALRLSTLSMMIALG